MTTKTARLAILLSLTAVLCGCGKSAAPPSNDLPRTDPYMQTLYAAMNFTACKFVRRNQPAPHERAKLDAAITEFEHEIAIAEASARLAGNSDYIERGKTSFRNRMAMELHPGCHPNETKAERDARSALKEFRRHVDELERRG